MLSLRNTSGFTLVELVISLTIFALMSIVITSIYLQLTYIGQKMRHSRHLSETAREITDRIWDDVREKWLSWYTLSPTERNYQYWNNIDYSASGTEILGIGDGTDFYLYGKKTAIGINPCTDTASENTKSDKNIHCGLYKIRWSDGLDKYKYAFNLVDSYIPEEEKKRVKIEDLRFYISGDGITTEKKVTLVFTLALMPRIGVPASLIMNTRLHVQTTFSERFYKVNS